MQTTRNKVGTKQFLRREWASDADGSQIKLCMNWRCRTKHGRKASFNESQLGKLGTWGVSLLAINLMSLSLSFPFWGPHSCYIKFFILRAPKTEIVLERILVNYTHICCFSRITSNYCLNFFNAEIVSLITLVTPCFYLFAEWEEKQNKWIPSFFCRSGPLRQVLQTALEKLEYSSARAQVAWQFILNLCKCMFLSFGALHSKALLMIQQNRNGHSK